MAVLSKGIKLGYKATSSASSYTDLTNLTEIPALGGSTEKVDVTTLDDNAKKYIEGIKDYGDIQFKFIYDETQFNTLNGLDGSKYWQVTLPATSQQATAIKATFTGIPSVALEGAGVNAALTYTLTITLDSEITFA